jgi:hypothetical protein
MFAWLDYLNPIAWLVWWLQSRRRDTCEELIEIDFEQLKQQYRLARRHPLKDKDRVTHTDSALHAANRIVRLLYDALDEARYGTLEEQKAAVEDYQVQVQKEMDQASVAGPDTSRPKTAGEKIAEQMQAAKDSGAREVEIVTPSSQDVDPYTGKPLAEPRIPHVSGGGGSTVFGVGLSVRDPDYRRHANAVFAGVPPQHLDNLEKTNDLDTLPVECHNNPILAIAYRGQIKDMKHEERQELFERGGMPLVRDIALIRAKRDSLIVADAIMDELSEEPAAQDAASEDTGSEG